MRYKFLLILCLLFLFVGCNTNNDEIILNEFLESYTFDVTKEEFDLPNNVTFKGKNILLEWNFSKDILDENNQLIHFDTLVKSTVTLTAKIGKCSKAIELGEIVSKSLDEIKDDENKKILDEFFNQYKFIQDNDHEIVLIDKTNYNNYEIKFEWSFSESILDKDNKIIHKDEKFISKVILKATLDKTSLTKEVGEIISLSKSEMNEKYLFNDKEVIDKFKELFVFKQENDDKLNFVSSFNVDDKEVLLEYEYDKRYFKSNGEIIHLDKTIEREIFVIASYGVYSEKISLGKVLVKSALELLNEVVGEVNLPKETNDDLNLVSNINGVDIEWFSDDENVITNDGECMFVSEEKEVIIEAIFSCGNKDTILQYKVLVKPYSISKRFELIFDSINFSEKVSEDLDLKEEYPYEVKAIWQSNRTDAISNSGKVTLSSESINVVLKLKLYIGEEYMEKEFSVKTAVKKKIDLHYNVERAADFDKNNMFNLELKDGKVSLKSGEIYGYYDSAIYETLNYEELVASWAAVSSTSATCELLIKIRVNGKWSKYFTYGVWGLGRNNLYYDQADSVAKVSVDEIIPLNGLGDAVQYRIILRRDSSDIESAKLSLIALAFRIPNYEYKVDVSGLNSFVDYDVPKVNQNVVPVIGNSICSATTSTMLLKYKGFDFSEFDEYENRYIANLVADRGHNSPTYGNWVYNTVTMGAYGLNSYVKHMYSWDELKLHLATVGPVGASISGNTGLYTTGGHLIVVRGYREVDGKTYVICNDPNINERFGNDENGNPLFVYYEFPLETFMNFWRGTIYVVE